MLLELAWADSGGAGAEWVPLGPAAGIEGRRANCFPAPELRRNSLGALFEQKNKKCA